MGALMARKDVLKGLMTVPVAGPVMPQEGTTPAPPVADADQTAPLPALAPIRQVRGAIGAVSQSIADLKARAVIDLDPHLIEAGGMLDRIESNDADDAALMQSIADYGQQVPILVRPHPSTAGRYQIVYGRRRVLAMRSLGQTVKALVRELDDTELVMAQGQENSARRDLSFIEKVVFAQQLDNANYGRKAICDALSVDKTLISRMLSIAERIPIEAIYAIGAAPGIGRDRWSTLADMADADVDSASDLAPMARLLAKSGDSNARFEAALGYLRRNAGLRADIALAEDEKRARTSGRKVILRGRVGVQLGEAVHGVDMVVLRLRKSRTRGFEDWLIASLPELHRQWEAGPDTPQPVDDKAPDPDQDPGQDSTTAQ